MDDTYLCNTKQIAALLGGLSVRRVQQLVHEGLPQMDRASFDARAAVGWYIDRLKAAAEGAEGEDIKQARKRLYQEQTRKYRYENDRLRGELIHADDLSALVTTVTGLFAQQLDAMPARMGLIVANVTDPERCQALIRRECDNVRNEVAEAYDAWLSVQSWSVVAETGAGDADTDLGDEVPAPPKRRKPRARKVAERADTLSRRTDARIRRDRGLGGGAGHTEPERKN